MPYNINFLKDRRKRLTKQDIADRQIMRYTLYVLGGVLAVMVLVLSVRGFLWYRTNQVAERQAQLKRAVLSQEDIEKSYVIFANKIKILRELLDERANKQVAIDYFSGIFGDEVLIREIEYESQIGILSFGLKANNVFVLENVFTILNSDQVKNDFSSVSKSELRRGNDGSYNVKVIVGLVKEKPAPVKAPNGSDAGVVPEAEL